MTPGNREGKYLGLALAGVTLLVLGACGREESGAPADQPDAGATETAETAAPLAAPVETRPLLRAGLWSMTTESDGLRSTTRLCVDRAMQEAMSILGGQTAGGGACREASVNARPGGGWTVRSICDMGSGGRTVTDGVVTGDFDSGWRQEATSVTTGAAVAHMNRTVTIATEARREGDCPEGMRAGDMEGPGGIRLNMLEMAEIAASMQAR